MSSTYPWGEENNCGKSNYLVNCVGETVKGNNCKSTNPFLCIGDTAKVGSYASGKSPYGTFDMAGNVWEWVNDWYDENYYQSSPSSDPLGPDAGQYRVARGGSWSNYNFNTNDFARSAYRDVGFESHEC